MALLTFIANIAVRYKILFLNKQFLDHCLKKTLVKSKMKNLGSIFEENRKIMFDFF